MTHEVKVHGLGVGLIRGRLSIVNRSSQIAFSRSLRVDFNRFVTNPGLLTSVPPQRKASAGSAAIAFPPGNVDERMSRFSPLAALPEVVDIFAFYSPYTFAHGR
jgi:hypothetical protein